MGLFKNMFGTDDQQQSSQVPWKMLTNVAQLDDIIEESAQNPILIFKHSTRCGISRMTLKRFEGEFDQSAKVTPYYLDLLQHRDISDSISRQFNVVHQSPQVLLVKEGKCIYDASHEAIEVADLASRL